MGASVSIKQMISRQRDELLTNKYCKMTNIHSCEISQK